MDIEQLKLILETLQAAGEGASDLFILWLILDKLVPTFGWLATFGGLMWIAKYITDAMKTAQVANVIHRYMSQSDAKRLMYHLKEKAGE